MAKKTAAQVDTEQRDIPEQHRGNIKRCDDGKHIIVSFMLPLWITVLIRKSVSIDIDVSRIAGASRLIAIFLYGLGRKMRDGAMTRMVEKDEHGNVTERKLTEAEKMEFAISHAEMRREWIYGDREQQTRGGVDAETQECRAAMVQYLCNKMGMTSKSVPSEIAKAQSVSDVMQGAKQAGVPAKAIKALIKRGRAIAELRSEEIDIDI